MSLKNAREDGFSGQDKCEFCGDWFVRNSVTCDDEFKKHLMKCLLRPKDSMGWHDDC
ncbi:MAG TPA: hypothetical protein VF817_03910 [Patescibacteria group bacterium]